MNEFDVAQNQHEMSSNEFYGFLNQRFDSREQLLIALGFKRTTVPGLNMAVYTRERHGRVYAVAAATLSHAMDRAWKDILEEITRFIG